MILTSMRMSPSISTDEGPSVDLLYLDPFERILLTTDGTVTRILEAQYAETIRLVKLFEGQTITSAPLLYAAFEEAVMRKVLLRGQRTHRNYLYAESTIVLARLNPAMRTALQKSDKPVGQLMVESRMECFREILSWRLEPASDIGRHFHVGIDAPVLSRTYRIFIGSRPVMLITEKFPKGPHVV